MTYDLTRPVTPALLTRYRRHVIIPARSLLNTTAPIPGRTPEQHHSRVALPSPVLAFDIDLKPTADGQPFNLQSSYALRIFTNS